MTGNLLKTGIAYEVGLACALGIDVWVDCNNVVINFPVPYLNNYIIGKIDTSANSYDRKVLQYYLEGRTLPFGFDSRKSLTCPNSGCGAKFNFHNTIKKGDSVICPTCLKPMIFDKGWLLNIS